MKLNSVITGMIAGFALVAAAFVSGADKPQPVKPAEPVLKKFMRAKLSASNSIMEGLVTEDFALVINGAKKLSAVSADEKWRISNDALYRQHSQEFRRIVERLQKSAQQENLDLAALTWIEATMSCIECHKHARAILLADTERIGQ